MNVCVWVILVTKYLLASYFLIKTRGNQNSPMCNLWDQVSNIFLPKVFSWAEETRDLAAIHVAGFLCAGFWFVSFPGSAFRWFHMLIVLMIVRVAWKPWLCTVSGRWLTSQMPPWLNCFYSWFGCWVGEYWSYIWGLYLHFSVSEYQTSISVSNIKSYLIVENAGCDLSGNATKFWWDLDMPVIQTGMYRYSLFVPLSSATQQEQQQGFSTKRNFFF